MTTTNSSYVGADEGVHHLMIDGDHVAKATVRHDDGGFEVFEVHAVALPPAPPHVSPWTAVLYVLEGAVDVWVDGRQHRVERGGLMTVPAGTPVTFAVVGATARLLVITSGDGAGRFFADFSASVPVDRPVEESMTAILSVAQRHGVSVAAPTST